jgi:hypothetical protein
MFEWSQKKSSHAISEMGRRSGDRLVYAARPQPGPIDGRMIVITLVWQKLR